MVIHINDVFVIKGRGWVATFRAEVPPKVGQWLCQGESRWQVKRFEQHRHSCFGSAPCDALGDYAILLGELRSAPTRGEAVLVDG